MDDNQRHSSSTEFSSTDTADFHSSASSSSSSSLSEFLRDTEEQEDVSSFTRASSDNSNNTKVESRRSRLCRFVKVLLVVFVLAVPMYNASARANFLGMMTEEIYISPYPLNATLDVAASSGSDYNVKPSFPRAAPVVMPMLNDSTLPLPPFEFSLCGAIGSDTNNLYCPIGYQCLLTVSLCFVNLTESSSFNATSQNIHLCHELLSAQDIVIDQQGHVILGVYRPRGATIAISVWFLMLFYMFAIAPLRDFNLTLNAVIEKQLNRNSSMTFRLLK